MPNERVKKILGDNKLPKVISENLESDEVEYSRNCENIIGSIKVPVGIVGPIKYKDKDYIMPIATTEAVLIASISRGIKIINLSDNLTVSIQKIGITRAPVYKLKKIKSLSFYKKWFTENKDKLQEIISLNSKHTKLIKINPVKYKGLLYVKFFFDTNDAMGMNMATIACENMNPFICSELNATCIALSSNFCSDKKASIINQKEGRGYKVLASIKLSEKIITEVLKTNIKSLKQSYQAKIIQGSKLAKSIAQNSHHANIIAGIFIATGQDPAHIVDGSIGSTIAKFYNNKVEFKIQIPCLVCGTVGGGTKLTTQQEALKLIGAADTKQFAELIAITVLAGEISLLGSIAKGTLAQSHEKAR